MRNANFTERLPTYHAIRTDETEKPWDHLVATAPVMAVEQNNFRHFLPANLPFTAQTKHVFGVFAFSLIACAGLAGKKRLKTFRAQIVQQGDGRNVRVGAT